MDEPRYQRRSVPVRALLLEDVSEHPELYGLGRDRSEASRLQALLELGAETARRRVQEQEMEAVYGEWAADRERTQAVADLADAVLSPGGLVDEVIGRAPEATSLG
jgi:hypothetical protein